MPFIKREYFLSTIKRLTFVNSIELFFNKGSQYAMATGSKAKILETYKFDRITQVKLPSGKIKIFDMYATCNHSPLLLGTKKKLLFDCKRYYRFRGFGPNVRGVAMNAIDHPHGGKTKSLKYPKTP
jgi:large subunit ribosomal protein L2